MTTRFAFAGFRHGHINGLYKKAVELDEIDLVAACEEDAATREELAKGDAISITHEDFEAMLSEVECDVVAVGDYYAKRGGMIIRALETGHHVIVDKPLCTSMEEQARIAKLSADNGLKVCIMLDVRDIGVFHGMRQMILDGAIGEVLAVNFGGQHPLRPGVRPGWYFEEGKHGGTINDIGIHAFDYIEWATGLRFTRIEAARSWNAMATDWPFLKDAGQVMLTMDNGCGVLGDVSYFAPSNAGFKLPQYWRMTFWGREGVLETSCTTDKITYAKDGASELELIDAPPANAGKYLQDFLADVAGNPVAGGLNTTASLRASELALRCQRAADEGLTKQDL